MSHCRLIYQSTSARNPVDNEDLRDLIERSTENNKAAGITGTPAFVIGGYFLSGAQPLPKFETLVRYALKHPAPKP